MADSAGNTPLPVGNAFSAAPASAIFPTTIGPQIASPSPYIIQVRLFWNVVDTLWEGTEAMRLAGRRFLPQEPLEDDDHYARRLLRTTLHNYYKRTIQAGVAKIFTKDTYLEDAPPTITDFTSDVDTQGRNISQFSKELLEGSVNHGVGYLLVDYANVPNDFPNLAAEQASGNRPYWVNIPAANVLDARSAKFSDGERLAYFKFEEEVTELSSDLSTTNIFQQIRIFKQDPAKPAVLDVDGNVLQDPVGETDVYFAVYRRETVGAVATSNWVLQRWGTITPKQIPVSPVYTNKIGFFIGKPPLLDLADINIEHWQAKSDYNNILHVANVPILFGKGMRPELDDKGGEKKIKLSADSGIFTSLKDAELSWVEHSGKSIAAARQNLKDLEARMESLGMVLTTIQNAGVSATANTINAAEANSMLKSYALNLQDTLDAALDFTAQYLDVTNTARVIVNTEYAIDYTTNTTMGDVINAFNAGVIDKLTVIAEGKRRNVFDQAATIVPPVVNESSTPGTIVPASPPDTTSDDEATSTPDAEQ